MSSKRLLGLGVIIALFVALPLFVWGIVTQKFDLRKRAQIVPSTCIPQNNVITVVPSGDSNTCHDIQAAIDAVTGDGYTVRISSGTYDIYSTINVDGKTNLAITGDPQAGSGAVVINSAPGGGWGILVQNSSGSIEWLTMTGGSSNGMLSIINSNNFSVGYASLNSQTSHTVDIQGSSNITVYNTEIQSSAGALEVLSSSYIDIFNNKIHDSNNAISINNSQNIQIIANLIHSNRESGITLSDIANITASHNTITNNGLNGVGFPGVRALGNFSGIISISDNIVAMNNGGGLHFEGSVTNLSGTFERNDIYGNYTNYSGVPDQTGINGNISSDPVLNNASSLYCPAPNSPVIWGDVGNFEYMGYIGPCSTATATPTASPTPTSTATATATATASPIIPGDINGDGQVNIVDLGIIIDHYGEEGQNVSGDLNGDGIVNIVDIGIVIDNY